MIALGACGAGSGESARDDDRAPTTVDLQRLGSPYLGMLHFDWGVNCAVAVREHVTKGKTTAELTYELRISRVSDAVTIAFADMRIDRLNGERAAAPPSLRAGYRLPDFEIGDAGNLVAVSGTQDLISELGVPATPALVATLEETVASKYWGTWVGLWADLESIDEVERTVVVPQELNGVSYDVEMTISSLGTTSDGLIALRLVEVIDGDDFARAFLGVTGSLGSETTIPHDFEGSRTTTIEVVTNPDDLRTEAAWFTQEIAVTAEGRHQERSETRSWVFNWAESDCA